MSIPAVVLLELLKSLSVERFANGVSMKYVTAAFLLICGTSTLSAQVERTLGPTDPVKVSGGEIAGAEDGTLKRFLGVPFAAPPVGALRWRAPQPPVPWSGVRKAQRFSAACAQTADWIPGPKSEDCLYLNVWAPRNAKGLPVIVWIHGGGYYGGTGAQPLYDGSNLAKRGVIVVTLNYRLGIFGFFSHPQLTAESPGKASGNQGILDQIFALRWVKNNVAQFGGDPRRVTVMGESSGAESVAILIASPLAKGLFQRAIAESGNDAMPISPEENADFDRNAAEAKGLAFAVSAGAKNLARLRAMSAEAVQKHAWSPRTIVDGYVLREDLTTTYRNNRQNDVPLLVGWNAQEGKDLAPEILGTNNFTAANHKELVTKLLGYTPPSKLLTRYPGSDDKQAKASIDQLTNDWWGWRMWYWAALQRKYGRAPAYVYFFAHPPAPPLTPCGYACGVGHGVEIQYVFDNLHLDPRHWAVADRDLATQLAKTWVAFARSGSPNKPGLPVWPAFNGSPTTVRLIAVGGDAQMYGRMPDFTVFERGSAK